MNCKSYKVQYKDDMSERHSVLAQAKDSYDARLIAMKKVKYLDEHPHAIDRISLDE